MTRTNRLRRRVDDARSAVTILGSPRTAAARSLVYADGRRAVRLAFLAGAASTGYLSNLPGTPADIALKCGARRTDRLDAWLRVGLALGELREKDGQLIVAGRRALAIAANDPVVTPFYRSVAEYYLGPHQQLEALVHDVIDPGEQFDVVTLLNNAYYFTEASRSGLMTRLVSMVAPGGEIVVASQCATGSGERGSIAAAQLDLLLRVQREANASLPTAQQVEALVANAPGVVSLDVRRPLPGEPYVVVRGAVA